MVASREEVERTEIIAPSRLPMVYETLCLLGDVLFRALYGQVAPATESPTLSGLDPRAVSNRVARQGFSSRSH